MPFPNLALVNSKKIEIIPSIFSDHTAVRLDVNYRKKKKKLLNIPMYGGWTTGFWITNKSQKKFKKNQDMHRNDWKLKHNPKPMEHCKNSANGKVHSNTGLPWENKKKSNK